MLRFPHYPPFRNSLPRRLSVLIFPWLVILLFLGACASKHFSVEISLPGNTDTAVRLLFYASDKKGGRLIETVVPVHGGKGSAQFPAVNPAVVYVMTSANTPVIAFYAERGDKMEITSDSSDPLSWMVRGNSISEKWSEWRLANLDALRSGDAKKINAAVASYVKAHPDEKTATLILLTSYDRRVGEKEFSELWDTLSEKVRTPETIDLIASADMVSADLASASSSLPEITLRTVAAKEYADTLRPAAQGASIILFWHNSMQHRKDMMRRLRTLASEYPDSAGRLIADICLDYDSVAWRMPLPSDSLKHTVRGWIPKGEADLQVMDMGVKRTPWWIVADGKGKIIYRGDDAEEAEKKFRSGMKK